jgi:hypothetical protein
VRQFRSVRVKSDLRGDKFITIHARVCVACVAALARARADNSVQRGRQNPATISRSGILNGSLLRMKDNDSVFATPPRQFPPPPRAFWFVQLDAATGRVGRECLGSNRISFYKAVSLASFCAPSPLSPQDTEDQDVIRYSVSQKLQTADSPTWFERTC